MVVGNLFQQFYNMADSIVVGQLLGVNGIGPKGALGILSALRPEDLRLAVMTGDAKAISRAPGVGAKTAQRIILDLKDKVQAEDLLTPLLDGSAAVSPAAGNGLSGNAAKEAVEALVALGYTNAEAVKAGLRAHYPQAAAHIDALRAQKPEA